MIIYWTTDTFKYHLYQYIVYPILNISKGGEIMYGQCGHGMNRGHKVVMRGCCEQRGFLTKEEKIEMLKEYKEALENEAKGVSERIIELEKNN
jgi:hypothetical protein